MKNYPLRFEPILKEKIWGGDKLKKILNKKSFRTNIGESWEISGVSGDVSVVANGPYKGRTLDSLLKEYKERLVGEKNFLKFGVKFPLLIKFIDARTELSVQLHPSDEIAQKRHSSFGKTEMWHILRPMKRRKST